VIVTLNDGPRAAKSWPHGPHMARGPRVGHPYIIQCI